MEALFQWILAGGATSIALFFQRLIPFLERVLGHLRIKNGL
jgi:hypothetical protein